MKEVVIINGTGGSGKDTFVSYVGALVNVYNFDSVGKVKELARIVGWDGIRKTEKDRKFLSDLKKLTTLYNDMSFEEIKKGIECFQKSFTKDIMFIHIREPEEIAKVIDFYPEAKTLLIKRANYNNITSNVSDANVDNYNYDYIIYNETLVQLRNEAEKFIYDLQYNCQRKRNK